MKKKLTRKEVFEKIEEFFSQKKELDPKYVKKIKRLAMRYNTKLKEHRKKFCKKCFADLRQIRGKINNGYKTVICEKCGARARWKI